MTPSFDGGLSAVAASEKEKQQATAIVNLQLMDGFYSDDGLVFTYPQGSQKKLIQTAAGPVFIVYLPGGNGINFSVLTQLHDEPITLTEVKEEISNAYGTEYSSHELRSDGEYEVGGQPAYQRTWQGTRSDNGIVFENWQIATVVDNKLYMFSLSGPKSDIEPFKKAAEKIVKSVRFQQADE